MNPLIGGMQTLLGAVAIVYGLCLVAFITSAGMIRFWGQIRDAFGSAWESWND